MTSTDPSHPARRIHIVTLACKDADHARRCLDALANYGRPDALAYRCEAYEFGVVVGTADTIQLVERWHDWKDLDALLGDKVVPALPLYNEMLRRPFDPARDTVRVELVGA
jgi:hypothetical protein